MVDVFRDGWKRIVLDGLKCLRFSIGVVFEKAYNNGTELPCTSGKNRDGEVSVNVLLSAVTVTIITTNHVRVSALATASRQGYL